MAARRVHVLAATFAACLAGAVLVGGGPGCYDEPQPLCGFQCAANGNCPDDYACSPSSICRLKTAPMGTVCPGPLIDADDTTSDDVDDDFSDISDVPPDDGVPFDADGIPFDEPPFPDSPLPDAPLVPDAVPDAMPDAPPADAMPDAPPADAMPDAP